MVSPLARARWRSRVALAARATCAASSRVPALPQAPFKLHNAQPASCAAYLHSGRQVRLRLPAPFLLAARSLVQRANAASAHYHPPACPRWARLATTGRCWCPYPASRRCARKLLPPASSCLILVMLFAGNPLHAGAAFAAADALVVVKYPATIRSTSMRAVEMASLPRSRGSLPRGWVAL